MEIVKARCHFSLRFEMGHNFLSSSLIGQLFTNPILRKNTLFKCKCNLRREADRRSPVSIANNHLQRGNQPKQRPAAVSLRLSHSPSQLCSQSHLPQSFSYKAKGSQQPLPWVFQAGLVSSPGMLGELRIWWVKPVAITFEGQNWRISLSSYQPFHIVELAWCLP